MVEYEAKKLLHEHGLPVTKEKLARSAQEAVRIAEEIGFPVVLKVQSQELLHKSDAGGVKIGLSSAEEVVEGFNEIMNSVIKVINPEMVDGILVQELVPGGVEVIIGCNYDPQIGPVIMLGIGGIFVEILQDVALGIPPLSCNEIERMIQGLKGSTLLFGARGQDRVDISSLRELLLKFSSLVEQMPQGLEIDLNPVIVTPDCAKIVDALIIKKE